MLGMYLLTQGVMEAFHWPVSVLRSLAGETTAFAEIGNN